MQGATRLAPHSRLGPYEIIDLIGAGGMGEVYRATDTRLDRTVALKILFPDRAGVPENLDREAKAISALNHPNICTLYDVGRQETTDFLVMEFIDGKPLKGPYPLPEAIRLAGQILDALEAAHRRGIVHLDLKPANVLMAKSGVKLLDFGLAKVGIKPHAGTEDTKPLTADGLITGTVAYMAPEQLEGRDADARSDLFAFGILFYEMVTGRHPFERSSQTGLTRAIMNAEPEALTDAPPAVERVALKCLEKDPDARWQSAQDVKLALDMAMEATPGAENDAQSARWWWAIPAALAIAALAGFLVFQPAKAPGEFARLSVMPPKGFSSVTWPQISPDGHLLAFGTTAENKTQVWVRSLDSSTPRAFPNAERANPNTLFWSPESRSLGFLELDGRLARMDLNDGVVKEIASAGSNSLMRSSWGKSGIILFARLDDGRIYQVSAAGGTPTPVTTVDRSRHKVHSNPFFLADGRRFLYSALGVTPDKNELLLGNLDAKPGDRPRAIPLPPGRPVYLPGSPGTLLFLRENALMAQPFDVDSMRFKGEPVEIAGPVYWSISASTNGVLAYVDPANTFAQFKWVSREGKLLGTAGEPFKNLGPARLSPDGAKLALTMFPVERAPIYEIWLLDLARTALSRLTLEGGSSPVWSPDGKRIAFLRTHNGVNTLIARAADGSGREEAIYETNVPITPLDWSRDGASLLFSQQGAPGTSGNDLWIAPLGGDRKPYPFLNSRFDESAGRFSPDGKWIAFTSNETGDTSVYVQALAKTDGRRLQISAGGGRAPRWRADGNELFYRDVNSFYAVTIGLAGDGLAGTPKLLFEGPFRTISNYFPVAGGQKFLLDTRSEEEDLRPAQLLLNWSRLLLKGGGK